jgi:hypothetical protein
MATKKQKREAALARREEFLEKERALGQKAIEVAARKREIRNREAWKKGHEKHYKFVDECPHCSDIKEEQARKKAAEAVERVAAAAKKLVESKRTPISHLADEDEKQSA